jgi:hyaluronan synthase
LDRNQGKRAAMAVGIRATTAEVLVFVDSDSHPGADAVRLLVQSFADPSVGAVSGISFVRNAGENLLTQMQSARYFVSFQLLKAAESTLGAVSCCSGCFAAYRRAAVAPILVSWESQRFLGAACTYGDDRALTNGVIKTGWKTVYDSRAQAWTDAPTDYPTFFRQQLRWKKSWIREGTLLLGHIWRSRPIAFPSVLVATVAGFLSPVVMLVNLIAKPAFSGALPLIYLTGLYLVAAAYGLFYRVWRGDRGWLFAVLGTFFYLLSSIQIVWALLRLRDGSWGTRSATAAGGAA